MSGYVLRSRNHAYSQRRGLATMVNGLLPWFIATRYAPTNTHGSSPEDFEGQLSFLRGTFWIPTWGGYPLLGQGGSPNKRFAS